MDGVNVKQEIMDSMATPQTRRNVPSASVPLIELSSSSSSSISSSDSDSDDDAQSGAGKRARDVSGSFKEKKRRKKLNELGLVLPVGFLEPLSVALPPEVEAERPVRLRDDSSRQFWKAGDYEGAPSGDWDMATGGMDHVRVHPKFLHSNATSHKWALGAFAELLDNALDEVCNGATYANIDMLVSRKDGSRMLLIEDDGGGMDPDKMRQCMSLGYSAKSKIANTIGQYGNGFKTSTMRLGADVIVFSRCCGKDGRSPTQSIGLLSYTFLRSTGKEDIVVPMLDYERRGEELRKIIRSTPSDWNRNVDTIVEWSPFSSEADLLHQFNMMKHHGTRIIIYNLWENDQGLLELDFDADEHDIQLRGVNRDEKNIKMAQEYPNSRHFLTYRHSLRSYASILYLRLPHGFRIILRGIDVEHHNIVNDMMLSQEITYRPTSTGEGLPRDSNVAAVVTIGFVKDAKHHIDVQGFNVYHKNRLIKPFWRLWNAAGSDGRGVIGVLEANFVEPAHDKQGFERTTVLARLEARLVQMQKSYWSTHCHKIGYAPRRNKNLINQTQDTEGYPDCTPRKSSIPKKNSSSAMKGGYQNGHSSGKGKAVYGRGAGYSEPLSTSAEDNNEDDVSNGGVIGSNHKASHGEKSFGKDRLRRSSRLDNNESHQDYAVGGSSVRPTMRSPAKGGDRYATDSNLLSLDKLKQENSELQKRLEEKEEELLHERGKCKTLEAQLETAQQKFEELNKEQESLIDIFAEERDRREREELNLRKKIKEASSTIDDLLDRIKVLEKIKTPSTNKTAN